MSETKEEIAARLVASKFGYWEVGIGIHPGWRGSRSPAPAVQALNLGGSPTDLDEDEIRDLIEFLQTYLPICPDKRTIAHDQGRFCGEDNCEQCYRRERARAKRNYFGSMRQMAPQNRRGYVCLAQVGEKHLFFSSAQPEKRFREIEKQYVEPMKLLHRIKTDDQGMLKCWWSETMVEFYLPSTSLFHLPQSFVVLFKAQQEQNLAADDAYETVMRHIDQRVQNVHNLSLLVSKPDWDYSPEHAAEVAKVVEEYDKGL